MQVKIISFDYLLDRIIRNQRIIAGNAQFTGITGFREVMGTCWKMSR